MRFPARPVSAEALRRVLRYAVLAASDAPRTRSLLTPLEGGMPGPAFAPMVVVVRRSASHPSLRSLRTVQGDMNSDGGLGLGLLSWWATPAAERPDAMEQEEEAEEQA